MIEVGFGLSSEEQSAPALVLQAQMAEGAGFTRASISDHFHPWTNRQGESSFVWSVLGAIAATTSELHVATSVTCPIMRTHPGIIAQAAATTASLMEGRFILGLGSGEALNEHVFGGHWPDVGTRLEMLEESIEVIRKLWTGELVTHHGAHYTVENARVFSLPETLPPIYTSAFGPRAMEMVNRTSDGYIGTAPDADLLSRCAVGERIAYTKVCWGPDESRAKELYAELWPTSGLSGQLAQEIATPELFEAATDPLGVEEIVGTTPCGPDVASYIEMVKSYDDAGYDLLTIAQVGPDQEGWLRFWVDELQPALEHELQPA